MPVSVVDDYLPDAARGGACYVCGAGRRDVRDLDGRLRKERVVDLHQRIDFEGHLMVCETCVREAAALLGMVDPAASVAVAAELDQVRAERDELRREVAEAHQLVALIREYDRAGAPAAALVTVGVPEPAAVVVPVPDCGAAHSLERVLNRDALRCTVCGWEIDGMMLVKLARPGAVLADVAPKKSGGRGRKSEGDVV